MIRSVTFERTTYDDAAAAASRPARRRRPRRSAWRRRSTRSTQHRLAGDRAPRSGAGRARRSRGLEAIPGLRLIGRPRRARRRGLVRPRRHPRPRRRHRARPRRGRGARRPPLRAAAHAPLRRAGDRARLVRRSTTPATEVAALLRASRRRGDLRRRAPGERGAESAAMNELADALPGGAPRPLSQPAQPRPSGRAPTAPRGGSQSALRRPHHGRGRSSRATACRTSASRAPAAPSPRPRLRS